MAWNAAAVCEPVCAPQRTAERRLAICTASRKGQLFCAVSGPRHFKEQQDVSSSIVAGACAEINDHNHTLMPPYIPPRGCLRTLILFVASKPSSWFSSSSMVRCTSLSPPPPLFSVLALPIESTSSMKMMEGECSLWGAKEEQG